MITAQLFWAFQKCQIFGNISKNLRNFKNNSKNLNFHLSQKPLQIEQKANLGSQDKINILYNGNALFLCTDTGTPKQVSKSKNIPGDLSFLECFMQIKYKIYILYMYKCMKLNMLNMLFKLWRIKWELTTSSLRIWFSCRS